MSEAQAMENIRLSGGLIGSMQVGKKRNSQVINRAKITRSDFPFGWEPHQVDVLLGMPCLPGKNR